VTLELSVSFNSVMSRHRLCILYDIADTLVPSFLLVQHIPQNGQV
jgi:hypothetical protein